MTPLRLDFTYDEDGRVTHITRYGNLAGTLTVATTDTNGGTARAITCPAGSQSRTGALMSFNIAAIAASTISFVTAMTPKNKDGT